MKFDRGNRDEYLKTLDGLNEFDRLVTNLESGEFSIRILELAYRESIRRRTDIPEGARNLLVDSEGAGLISFASEMGKIVGGVELSYLRGRQEGHEVKEKTPANRRGQTVGRVIINHLFCWAKSLIDSSSSKLGRILGQLRQHHCSSSAACLTLYRLGLEGGRGSDYACGVWILQRIDADRNLPKRTFECAAIVFCAALYGHNALKISRSWPSYMRGQGGDALYYLTQCVK